LETSVQWTRCEKCRKDCEIGLDSRAFEWLVLQVVFERGSGLAALAGSPQKNWLILFLKSMGSVDSAPGWAKKFVIYVGPAVNCLVSGMQD
jgi:hypothetical protein